MGVKNHAYISEAPEADLMPNLLVVEPVSPLRSLLVNNLRCAGFVATGAGSTGEALAIIATITPDLVILSADLNRISASELTDILRDRKVPRLILADARSHNRDTGSPVLLKPFSPQEFVASVASMLRPQTRQRSPVTLCAGQLSLDTELHEVRWQGRRVELQPLAFRLLTFLMRHAGRVHTRASLLDAIWGANNEAGERAIDVQIRRLRAALAAEGCTPSVETLRGVGYRLAFPVGAEPSCAVARLRHGEKTWLRAHT